MKSFTLVMIVMWSIFGLVIISAIIYGAVFFHGAKRVTESDISGMELALEQTVPLGDIDKINLELASEECNVYLTQGDEINVKHYVKNSAASRCARLERLGGTLTVSTEPEIFSVFPVFGFPKRSIVDVYLPDSYKGALSAKLMSGTLTFGDSLDLSEISVNIASGTVRTDHAVKVENMDISISSGTVKATGGVEAGNYSIKTSSGTVTVSGGLTGSGAVNITSGTARLEGVDITENLYVKVNSGTANIEITGNPSLSVSGQKSSGTVRSYFYLPKVSHGSFSATVGEAPYKNLDVSVTSGTIRITQAD